MRRSTDHILAAHAGVLPRPPELQQLFAAGPDAEKKFDEALPAAVSAVVRHQADIGLDGVNDGEVGKRGGFQGYVRERMAGFDRFSADRAPESRGGAKRPRDARDRRDFPGLYASPNAPNRGGDPASNAPRFVCTGPLNYIGQDKVARDCEILKQAVAGLDVEPYLPAVAPGTMEHWLEDAHYEDDESFLFAIADVMHEEYRAITNAGIVLQIDNPDLPDGWQMYPEMSVAEYRQYAALRVEALNHALRDIPEELVRLHICWGSQHGPHRDDLALRDIIDIVLQVKAECYSIEAANPRHEHEWQVWQDVKLPEGKSLMPGVVGHVATTVEHPELVAWRLKLYADCVGRENVIAGTDCGLASRVIHGEVAWAKLEDLVKGAQLASQALW